MPSFKGFHGDQINALPPDDIVIRKSSSTKTGTTKPPVVVSHAIKVERACEDGSFVPKKLPKEFSLEIQRARQAKGWTQKELALKLGVTADIVKKYENGTIVPQGAVTGKIKQVLGLCKVAGGGASKK